MFQFGNTCYCNSVLQALYFCRPFREKILAYRSQPRRKENLLTCLADLFHSIANQKRKVGVIPPKKFITRLRKENGETAEREDTGGKIFFNALINTFLSCGLYLSTWIKTVDYFSFSTELFDNYMQQDAHEFLNYLLNTIADLLQEERKQEKTNGRLANGTLDSQNNNSNATPAPTWVHEIFQGTLTNETRCLTCETVKDASWRL